jgi:glycosyltransferase involved in cell wall biosynthesis
MPNKPLVSVIVTTRNNEATIATCLQSINSQTYHNLELIVVDNNSKDKTADIAKAYTEHVYTKGPERSVQRNFAASKAQGDYVLVIDSDMELTKDVVAECVSRLKDDTQIVIIPEESFGIGFWAQCKALERSFYNGVDWIEAPRFFNKELYEHVGGYDESIVGGEDWDLHSRVKQYTKAGRAQSFIRHDEGHLTLKEIIKSRQYYAKGFSQYFDKKQSKSSQSSGAKQALKVYGLFLSNPYKLFKNPITGIGVLFMKTVEFGVVAVSRR